MPASGHQDELVLAEDDDEPLAEPELVESMALCTALCATFWPIDDWCFLRLLWFCSDLLRICLSIFLTQSGNVFDQNDTYDWAVSGDLMGLEPPVSMEPAASDELAEATPEAAPPALDCVPEGLACAMDEEAGDDAADDDAAALLAAWASDAAELTI